MKITKQRLKEIIKEELNEASNPEWESADKILRGLVYLAQDLEDSTNAQPAELASAIVNKLREAVDAMERRLNDKFGVMNEDWDYEGDDDDAFLDAVQRGEADGAAGRPKNPNQVDRHHTKRYDAAYERALKKNTVVLKDPPDIKRMKQGLKRVSRPRSAGDFRSNKERFENP